MAGVRLLRLGVKPGSHPRGGRVHLQLWACERLAAAFGVLLARRHPLGRSLRTSGRLPRRAQRRPADPRSPVTGWAHARRRVRDRARDRSRRLVDRGGQRCTSAPSRSGKAHGSAGRSILMPGARVGAGAVIEPGTCVSGDIPEREVWGGSPAQCVGIAEGSWPAPIRRRSLWWTLVYTASLFGFGRIPLLAGLPWLVMLGWAIRRDTTLEAVVLHALVVAPVGVSRRVVIDATLLALAVLVLLLVIEAGLPQGRQPRGLERLAGREHGRRRPCDALPALRRVLSPRSGCVGSARRSGSGSRRPR